MRKWKTCSNVSDVSETIISATEDSFAPSLEEMFKEVNQEVRYYEFALICFGRQQQYLVWFQILV